LNCSNTLQDVIGKAADAISPFMTMRGPMVPFTRIKP
jgi:hypothetical protein